MSDVGFEDSFKTFLETKREVSKDVDDIVRDIISDIRKNGDTALFRYTEKFDRINLEENGLRVLQEDIENAQKDVAPQTLEALTLAHDRIRAHHERQRPENTEYTDETGTTLGARWTAVDAAGLYVPGGLAAYPSSVLMNAIPAMVAGVERVVITVPAPDGILNPLVLAAAHIAGVSEIYKVGGAQAIAALAYGTETIAPVSTIVGPGNAFVAAAKRQVFGQVGIDMVAGPSEVLVVADGENDPSWIAADLLAQAEHDTSAQSILLTDSESFAKNVEIALADQLKGLPKADIASKSWETFGAIILVPDVNDAVPVINRIAPEHLQIQTRDAEELTQKVKHAGAIFVGRYTPEAIGDYVAGSNHVLPTARSARYASGLSVLDFMKRSSILKCTPDSLRQIGPAAIALGAAEGLDAHARSVSIRMNF